MKVLVVDDDPDQAIIRCMLLSHHGFETRRAGDPESALRVALDERPELAVLDLGLPAEEDGLRLIDDLKIAIPHLGVILLTGSDPERLRKRLDLSTVDEILQKGHSSKVLLASLSRLAAKRAA